MNRVEKYRQIRRVKRKFRLTVLLCVLLLISGACVADYSVNLLIKNNNAISLVTLKDEDSYVELSLLNSKLYFNTSYMDKDLRKLKDILVPHFTSE